MNRKMNRKHTIRLNEGQLKRVVTDVIHSVLNESKLSEVRNICDELEEIKERVSSVCQEICSDENIKIRDHQSGNNIYSNFFMRERTKIAEEIDSMINQYRKFYGLQ